MTPFFADLEAQLEAAARAQAAAARPPASPKRPSRIRAAARAVPALLAVAISIVVAVIAIVLAHHAPGHNPASTPTSPSPASGPPLPAHPTRRQRQEENYIYRAENTVVRRDQACFGQTLPSQAKPTFSQGSPSAELLSILGVLRRPAGPADKLPARITYHPYRRDLNGTVPPVKKIYGRYIRYARHRDGANYYLVPAGNINYRAPIPNRCYNELRVAIERELRLIPTNLRAGTLALEPRFLAQTRQDGLPYPGVCLLGLNDTGNGDGGCGAGGSISSIEEGRGIETGAPGGVPVVDGLAPDGVKSITFYYPGRHPLTALVINNVFVLHNPHDRLPNYGFPDKMVWRAANGKVIKTISFRR